MWVEDSLYKSVCRWKTMVNVQVSEGYLVEMRDVSNNYVEEFEWDGE